MNKREIPLAQAQAVVNHAAKRHSRGRKPSMAFGSETNPIRALKLAQAIVRLNGRTAIFSTSAIQAPYAQYEGQEPNSSTIDDGRVLNLYSTGALEDALEQGFKVIVLTTRSKLYTTDDWWLKLIGGTENVIFTIDHGYWEDNDVRNARLFKPWRTLFKQLGIPFPEHCTFWTQIMHNLEAYGLVNGYAFKQRWRDRKAAA